MGKIVVVRFFFCWVELETEFSIAFCRLTGDKWQSKTLFLMIFDPRSSSVKSVFDFCRSGVW